MSDKPKPFVFVDTCSLLDSCWNMSSNGRGSVYSQSKEKHFWGREFSALEQAGSIIVPLRNWQELEKFSEGARGKSLQERSRHVLQIMSPLVNTGRMQIVGDKNEPFADAIILSVALKFITPRNLFFITQDRALAKDLNAINQFGSITRKRSLMVKRVGYDGSVEDHRGLARSARSSSVKLTPSTANAGVKGLYAKKVLTGIRPWWIG